VLRVRTKSDIDTGDETAATDAIGLSAETGEGLARLMSAVDDCLSATAGAVVADMPILTRSRHIHGIGQAREEVAAFGAAWRQSALPATVAAVHLRSATTALESLIGAVSTEDVLDRVFSSFCVGK
jgi:tRNA modification GTPase